MYFNHYTNRPVELAVQLVNTDQIDHDEIAELSDLTGFLEAWSDLWSDVALPPTEAEFHSIRALRGRLREIFEAADAESAADKINHILTDYGAVPQLSLHSGEPHFHFEPTGSAMCSWLGAVTAMGLAAVIVEHGIDRFGVCNANDCRDVYVDSSRNRSRRHCSNTCSTREAVAAHRRRKGAAVSGQ